MIVLGIDPGYALTGYGIISKEGSRLKVKSYGVIKSPKNLKIEERLKNIFTNIKKLIKRYDVNVMAVEKLFFNKNTKTALLVGEARGIAVLAASLSNIKVYEYTPLEVKISLTGYGRSEKYQVGKMVKTLLNLDEIPKPDDITDALAVAVCFLNNYKIQRIKENDRLFRR